MATCKEEILRKNALIQGLRSEIDDFRNEINEKSTKISQLSDELEKLKRNSKENARKDQNYKTFQEKLEQSKASEKQMSEERAVFLEKIKLLRTDLQRKEAFNRELKEKLDISLQKLENSRGFQDENERLKETLRKLRAETERKDQSLTLFKAKLDDFMDENSQLKANKAQNSKETKENAAQRLDFLKTSLKKSENTANLLTLLLKRLYREISSEIVRLKQEKTAKARKFVDEPASFVDEHAFSESLSILKLKHEDLDEFLFAKRANCSASENAEFVNDERKTREFEDLLLQRNGESLNPNAIYGSLSAIVQERLALERKT